MDKGWWARFTVVLAAGVAAWLTLWPSLETWVPMPEWVRTNFTKRISPGLDIRGGLRMVYEVEVEEAVRDRRDAVVEQLQQQLGERLGTLKDGESPSREALQNLRKQVVLAAEKGTTDRVRAEFRAEQDAAKLDRDLLKKLGDLREVGRDGRVVTLALEDDRLQYIRDTAVEQAKKTITNRIDELQIRETSVTSRGEDIVIEVPGADEAAFDRIRDIISRTARLEFKIVDDQNDVVANLQDIPEGIEKRTERAPAGEGRAESITTYLYASGEDSRKALEEYINRLQEDEQVPPDHQLLLGKVEGTSEEAPAWRTYYVFARSELTGDYIDEAFVTFDERENNRPAVALNFNSAGARIFGDLTERNVKRRMAIVLDDQIDSSPPVINEKIGGGQARISMGGFRNFEEIRDQAQDLVVVLRAGALPAPIRPSNQQRIGASLGKDSVKLGAVGALVGIGLALLFMLFYYEVAGLVADTMVLLNLLLLLAVLAFFEGTLTLPGIAGIALTVGMALDANVLITERLREELAQGRTPRAAVEQGYKRALSSIFDSQLTTFIAGVVLLQYGSGPIKGFAVTLLIGIGTSLFTGVFCSKVMMDWVVKGLRVQKLRAG